MTHFSTIKSKILTAIMIPLFFGMGIIGAISYWAIGKSVSESAFVTMQKELSQHFITLNMFFKHARQAFEFTMDSSLFEQYFSTVASHETHTDSGHAPVSLTDQQKKIKRALEKMGLDLQDHFPVVEICLVDRSGSEHLRIVRGKVEGKDELSHQEHQNPFFKSSMALKPGETLLSEPYISPDIHAWVVAYSAPVVLGNGEKPAFFHFEIPLSAIQNLLKQPTLSQDEKSSQDRLLIIDTLGLIVADTNRSANNIWNAKIDHPGFPKLEDYLPRVDSISKDENFLRIVEQIKDKKSGQGQFATDEAEYQIIYQPLGVFQWSIALIKPYGHLLAGSLSYDQVMAILIVTPVLILLFGAGAGYLLAESLAKPVRALDAASREISQGQVDLAIQVTGHDEIGRLAATFKQMASDLDAWKKRLTTEQVINREKDALLLQMTQEASRAKSDFIANLSHEIRTPMNAIMGLTDLALRSEPDIGTQDYLEKIERASLTLMTCLNDILDFSKIDAGKLELYPVSFNPLDLFNALSDMFSDQVADKDLELVLSLPQNYFNNLLGDAKRVQQVFTNLLRNAIKFTPKGTIVVRAHPTEIKLGEVELAFSIQDTGIGIDPERIKYLFTPFSQADASISVKYGGSGLGLNICKQLVEMMGGRIWVESVLGQGSTFHFTVSMINQTEIITSMIVPEYLQDIRILVVDDHDLTREIMEEMLLGFKFFARSVDSGEVALAEVLAAMASEKPFDLIFMDWRMPGMDGLETAMAMRTKMTLTKPSAKRPKIIMLTAFGKSTIQHYAKSSGIDLFLHKPVNQVQLFNAILEVFGKSVTKQSRTERALMEEAVVAKKISGARVLMAEDNPINQKVGQEILERVGITVEIANNGKEALQMLKHTSFDLVLMDVQMPEMDGYTATLQIRSDPQFAQLPILAMTAHVLASAREKCFSVGMNDHITKPIHVHHFYEMLVKWLNPDNKNAHLGHALPQHTQPNHSTQNVLPPILDGIDMDMAMERFLGRQPFFKKMLLSFNHYTTIGHDIRLALARNDMTSARDMVHTMKGMAGNLAATDLYQAANAMEQAIEQKQPQEISTLLTHFEAALHRVLTTVRALESQYSSQESTQGSAQSLGQASMQSDVGPVTMAEIETLLKELADYLQARDTDAELGLAALKNVLSETEWQKELDQMETQINQFDYRGALTTLEYFGKSLREGR